MRFLVVIRQHLSDLVRGSVVAQVVQDISEPPERFDANDLAALYERVEDGIVNCSAVAFAEQVVLAHHNRWTLGTFLIIHAIAVGLYGSVEVTQLCPRNRSDPGAVHIEEVESMALRPVVQELPGVAFAAFARGKRPCSSRL